MDTIRPRLIRADDGMIDASKVVYVEAVEEIHVQLFRFFVGVDGRVFMLRSSDRDKLEEVRRRLIGFVWPNAHVFRPDQVDSHPLTPSPADTRKDCS